MRLLYSFLIVIGTPFALLYFTFRGLKDRAYLRRWPERFGFCQVSEPGGGILVHAASVGEFNAASPLIRALLTRYPKLPITVTSLTPTGSQRVRRELGDKVADCFIPFDLPGAVSRFMKRIRPSVFIVMETEIWPNLYLESKKMGIPLLMANARLSGTSVRRFQRTPGLVRDILECVEWIGAQSAADADRFRLCGADPERTTMTGNLKFDLEVPASLEERAAGLRTRWNRDRPVLVAGSTHEADEAVVIPAFVQLLQTMPDALLILVPRYPERFARAAQLARTAGLHTELRSDNEVCSSRAQCFVIDAIGELMTYYACADVAYVGGSMGEQGGHNALEPAALGKPVLFGPNMENAKEIAGQLVQCSAARRINDQGEFLDAVKDILTDGSLRERMGEAGRSLIETNKGALDLTLRAIKNHL